jgi:hypothetical protein
MRLEKLQKQRRKRILNSPSSQLPLDILDKIMLFLQPEEPPARPKPPPPFKFEQIRPKKKN